MKECCRPYTRSQLCEEYQFLIVNSHTSYILIKFVIFTQKYKIICLYLPLHLIHLLQTLDISIFSPLK